MKPVAFLVKYKIQVGEYEKMGTALIKSTCEDEAAKEALLGECHNGLDEGAEWLEEGQQIEDAYGEMIYTVRECKPVTAEQFEILKLFHDVYS